mgnify:CR=1 FL=1
MPVVSDAGIFKDKLKSGSVLEVWVERWGFQFTPIDWQTYTITMQVRSRLTRLEDGPVDERAPDTPPPDPVAGSMWARVPATGWLAIAGVIGGVILRSGRARRAPA